ncbi:ATP-binding protein [Actinomadura scrupuli]|uniref:ATP-binding protein n=1 Tax=Actinomadura scrupuli TaxID=559629 RepID=UPI003D99D4A3
MVEIMAAREGLVGSSERWLQSCGVMTWRRAYPGRMDQAAPARKFPALLLAETGRAEDAEWIAAEYISNALVHTKSGGHGGWFGVEVMLGKFALIAVHDLGGGGVPRTLPGQAGGRLEEHGRGLLGVSKLAARMGFFGNPADGHTVWAQLALGTDLKQQTS